MSDQLIHRIWTAADAGTLKERARTGETDESEEQRTPQQHYIP